MYTNTIHRIVSYMMHTSVYTAKNTLPSATRRLLSVFIYDDVYVDACVCVLLLHSFSHVLCFVFGGLHLLVYAVCVVCALCPNVRTWYYVCYNLQFNINRIIMGFSTELAASSLSFFAAGN